MDRYQSLVHGRPERTRLAGRLLVLGALVVWIGAITPTAIAVYTPPGATAVEMLPEILERPVGWQLTHLLFLSGIVITAAGLVALVRLFDRSTPRKLGLAAVVINVGGVLTWMVAVYFRVTLTSQAMVDAGAAPPLFVAAMTGWIYQLFSGLTLTSFATIGAAVITSGSMPRLGVYAVVASVLVAAVFVALGDMPLLVHYIITAPIGVSLMRRAARQDGRDNNRGTGGTTKGDNFCPLLSRYSGDVAGFEPRNHTFRQGSGVIIPPVRTVVDVLFRTEHMPDTMVRTESISSYFNRCPPTLYAIFERAEFPMSVTVLPATVTHLGWKVLVDIHQIGATSSRTLPY